MQTATRKTVVCIDVRRSVAIQAAARKAKEVAEQGHEQFIRNTLKDRLGWPRREPAPDSIKEVAKQMAAALVARDKELAAKKAEQEAEGKL